MQCIMKAVPFPEEDGPEGSQQQKGGKRMQFVIKACDGAGKLERRMEVRPRHLENMSKINGKVICAGGLLDEEGKMKGSLMVMESKAEPFWRTILRTSLISRTECGRKSMWNS